MMTRNTVKPYADLISCAHARARTVRQDAGVPERSRNANHIEYGLICRTGSEDEGAADHTAGGGGHRTE